MPWRILRDAIVQLPACRSVKITRTPVATIVLAQQRLDVLDAELFDGEREQHAPAAGDLVDGGDQSRREIPVPGDDRARALDRGVAFATHRLPGDTAGRRTGRAAVLIETLVEPLGGIDAAVLEQVVHRDHLGDDGDVLSRVERNA